jgi:putative membrane protein
MTTILVTWLANSFAIYAVAYLMHSVDVASPRDAFLAGALLSVVNAIVKPILVLLTLPLTLVTLGLFYFVVSAICLRLTAMVVPGFILGGWLSTIVAAILVSLFSTFITKILRNATSEPRRSRR